MKWETVIGLEIHTQLATESKIFSGSSCAYGAEPNTQACAIDLGMPGVLPVLNQKAVQLAVLFGLSVNGEITPHSVFARKNYFYPDLPKGYQISQYDLPVVKNGRVEIELETGELKTIGITRAHLEEDAGKSLHDALPGYTGIDLNRAGIPLLEIVSEPDMRSAKEAVAYMKALHRLVRYLEISDGNMQEGSFRCDVNISLRPMGSTQLGVRAEIKNLNSFRFVERAIEYEIERQAALLESGQKVVQETRLYDAEKDLTRPMRSKEEAHDYRYFPDPDLLPVIINEEFIQSVRPHLPELPWEKCARFKKEYGLSDYDARLLSNEKELSAFFENTLQHVDKSAAKLVANWITGDLLAALNKNNLSLSECPVKPEQLGTLIARITDNTLSNTMAKQVFEGLWQQEGSVDQIIEKKGLKQITDLGAIEKIIDEVIQNNPQQTQDYRSGKEKLFTFFVGQVMKATKGKGNPQLVNELLLKKLKG